MLINLAGDLKRRFEYLEIEGKHEPCMMLYRPLVRASAWIPLPCAYKYDEPKGRKQVYAVLENCKGIARTLQLPEDDTTLGHIATVIADGLDELIKMPPYRAKKDVIGEATLTVNGEKSHTVEVLD